jgi:uncharacterized cupin superfamily protein
VLAGELTFSVDGKRLRAGPGERLVVAPGVRHGFENTGTESAHLIVEADPTLRLRESIENGAALARAESFTARGRPAQPACVVGRRRWPSARRWC